MTQRQENQRSATVQKPPDEQAVSDYLYHNPDFFIRNARQVEQMMIPHPVKGSVSLVEWQLARQRTHIQHLEEEITLLMQLARANHQLFQQLLDLQSHLLMAEDFQQMLYRLHRWARNLGLAGAHIRLFNHQWQLGAPSEFVALGLSRQAFEPIRIQRLGSEQHYLGPLHGPELMLLMPEAKAIGSVAMSLISRNHQDVGVLIFSSRDNQHYQRGMGTEMLDLLAGMLPAIIGRWIARQ